MNASRYFLLLVMCAAASQSAFAQSGGTSGLGSGTKASGLDALKSGTVTTSNSSAGGNLIPNWNFSDPTPLKSWRVDFPYQDWYKKNVTYVKQTTVDGKRCAMLDLPAGIAGNEGAKIETALVPAEPGATYHVEVECYLPDFSAKLHAEAFAVNPDPNLQAPPDPTTRNPNLSVSRIPAQDGHPALIMIYRAQIPDPAKGSKWVKVERDFTIPEQWDVSLGKGPDNRVKYAKVKPAYLSVKAFTYEATMGAGKAYFTNFKLTKIKGPGAEAAPKSGIIR